MGLSLPLTDSQRANGSFACLENPMKARTSNKTLQDPRDRGGRNESGQNAETRNILAENLKAHPRAIQRAEKAARQRPH